MTAIQNKWAEMSWFRRVLLIVMLAEMVGFGIATAVTVGRWGLEYQGELLYPRREGDVTWYEGRVDGEDAAFSVAPDGTVEYRWGEYVYGPYQVVEDPTAVPEGYGGIGVEVRQGDEVLFRGCYQPSSIVSLIDENGEPLIADAVSFRVVGAVQTEEERREQNTPGPTVLVRAAMGPELTHKGDVGLYLAVTFIALLNIVQILFPEALFRLSMVLRVSDVDNVEPSEWYIFTEHVEWVILAGACLIFYAMALGTVA